MKKVPRLLVAMLLLLWCGAVSLPQERKAANPASAAPNFLVLVHQEFQPGKGGDRQKLETAMARACDRLEAPSSWISLQSMSGFREAVSFDPFESYELIAEAHSGWRQFYAAHPDLAQIQGEIDAIVNSERTIIAERRDDLSYLPDNIDLSEARYLRITEVRLIPGHESDFGEVARLWAEINSRSKVEKSWAVYEVKEGATSPSFVMFMPFSDLKENDELLALRQSSREETEGEGADRLKQVAREAFASTESNMYVVSPELSHVSKEFAAGDSGFWKRAAEPEMKPEARLEATPPKKKTNGKPQP